MNVSFPTRTIRLTVDPGPVWSIAPYGIFTRTYEKLFWQITAFTVVETRRAGTAIDLSLGSQSGGRLLNNRLTPGIGLLMDVRLANWCTHPGGGSKFCTHTRPGEEDRNIGSTRAYGVVTLAYNFISWSSLTASLQVPVTPKRDFILGTSLGWQIFF